MPKLRRVARGLALTAAVAVPALAAAPAARAVAARAGRLVHLLNRIALGPTAQDVARVRRIGIERYIAEQLDPGAIPESAALTRRLATLDTLKLSPVAAFAEYGPKSTGDGVAPTAAAQEARMKRADAMLQQERAARIWRALLSPRQLYEAMVDFWFNHFNVYAYDGYDQLWIADYEERAIRPYALGRFRDLLLATARHPAMLYYLNNDSNTAPGSPAAQGMFNGLNENYAREVMELHTLGVDGGYTQRDVTALARMLTGWGLDYANLAAGSGSAFRFDPARHDASEEDFLGQRIPAGGEAQGVAALDLLASSPATAHHIAVELAQYFVADEPPAGLVDRLAQRFRDSDGDIKAVMAALLASPEFRDGAGGKYKTPYQYVLSAVRAAGVAVDDPQPVLGAMAELGMPLYLCPTPDGYKNTEAAWLSPAAAAQRAEFAVFLGGGAFARYAAAPPKPLVAAAGTPARPLDPGPLDALLAPMLGERTRAAVAAAPARLQAALILGSPDFMRR